MTIEEVLELFIDSDAQIFTIHDCENGKDIFTGTMDDLDVDDTYLLDKAISSIDNIRPDSPKVVFNICYTSK